jgi:TolB-like protein
LAGRLVNSIAVLPFKLRVPDSGDEYLGIGLADALIVRLSKLRQVAVRPTSSVRKYGNAEQDPVAAEEELGVETVLDGNIHRAGDRVRVTAQLINVANGAPMWADKFDARFTDIFDVEDSISEQVGPR